MAPASLTFEITEQTAISNLDTAAGLMRRMREVGCQIALDDFGTGMNSLAALKGLPGEPHQDRRRVHQDC